MIQIITASPRVYIAEYHGLDWWPSSLPTDNKYLALSSIAEQNNRLPSGVTYILWKLKYSVPIRYSYSIIPNVFAKTGCKNVKIKYLVLNLISKLRLF